MLTTQWRLFDSPNKGHLPPLSLFELRFIATFGIIQRRSVHGSICSANYIQKRTVFPFFDGQHGDRTLLPNTTPPLSEIFIYSPTQSLVCRIPGEGKCIKPLVVFTCVGLTRMCDGRPTDGGCEIDHRQMSARGIPTSPPAFHVSALWESIRQKLCVIWEYILPLRLRHCCLLGHTPFNGMLSLIVLDDWLTLLVCTW